MRGDVVDDWVEALLDPGEDQRHAPTAVFERRRRREPNIVAATPRRIAFDDAPRTRKTSRIRIDDRQPVRPAGRSALDVVAFEEQLVVDRQLSPQLLCAAGGEQEQSMALAHHLAPTAVSCFGALGCASPPSDSASAQA